jgi:hypothetical protein
VKVIYLILISLCLFLIGCGKSPMFNQVSDSTNHIQQLNAKKVFATTSERIQLLWISEINTTVEGKVVVILTKDGAIFEDNNYTIGAYLWMKSMEHGSSPLTIAKLADGIYQLSELYFAHSGDWQLHLTLNKNNIRVEDVEFPFNLN